MKKILLFLSIVVALSVATNSCISRIVPEEIDPPEEPDVPTEKSFFLWFQTKQIEAITTYAYPNLSNSSVPSIVWGTSENVGVFLFGNKNTTLYTNKKFFLNFDGSINGNTTAVLRDTIITTSTKAISYGYYPYQSSLSGTTATFRLDNVQNQSADNTNMNYMDVSISNNLFMISAPTDSFVMNTNNNGGIFAFQSIQSILRFQVTKSLDFSTFNNQRIKNVQLYIADKSDISIPLNYNLAGDYSIDISKAVGTSGYQGPVFASGKGKNTITATVTGGNVISTYTSNSPYVWFIVNPVTIKSNECLVAIIETDKFRILYSYDITTLKPHNVYSFDVQATTTNTVSDQEVVTYFLKEKASNCYIIPRSGVCQIPLYTKNGEKLQGDTVVWLWASKENGGKFFSINELIDTTTIQSIKGLDYARFRVGTSFGKYTKGNVILALKDSKGDIVWTWHIWITDEPKEIEYRDSTIFLDRNIGAMSAAVSASPIDNYGFVYQWGRKDPFIGGDGHYDEKTSNVLSIADDNTIRNKIDTWPKPATTAATAETARKNPMLFICNDPVGASNPVDWLSLSVTPDDRWNEKRKTNNDPCPVGYRVPNKDEFNTLHEAAAAAQNDDKLYYFEYKSPSNRFWEYYYYDGEITSLWPAAGMRQGRNSLRVNNVTTVGAQLIYSGIGAGVGRCYYWTSSPVVLNDNSRLQGAAHRIWTANELFSTDKLILHDKSSFGDNADAYPIRCVKE